MSKDHWVRKIGNEMLDLVYPTGLYCMGCGKIIDGTRTYRLCNECMKSVKWVTERHCSKCGRPLARTNPGEMCFGCSRMEAAGGSHMFDKGHACTGYGAVEQAVIFAFKYGGMSDIGETLGEILYDRMAAGYGPESLSGMYDMVVPVPTFRDKKLMRGFDHTDLMAKDFARRAGLRYDSGAVVRIRATEPMKGLGPEERAANVRGAFSVRESRIPRINGARVLLIDDIFTTGSTIDEIAATLKHPYGEPGRHDIGASSGLPSGASRVDFLAFAAAADMIIG